MPWLTLLFCDCLPIVVQTEGPSLTPSQSSLMEADAWEMVGELLGAEKDPPWLRGHQGGEIWPNVRALVFRGSRDCEEYGCPDCASSLVKRLHIQVLRRGNYANQKLKLQL